MISGIYSIRNVENGKVYVGSAVNINRRWQEHRSGLKRGVHGNDRLKKAWGKYGESCFEFTILEKIEDIGQLVEREQFWIDDMNATDKNIGYNICPVAGKTCLGVKRSEETKAKMSAAQKGKPRSLEQRAKIAATLKGRSPSPETVAKLAASNTGKRHTPETRAKISASHIGIRQTESAKAKLSIAGKGRFVSSETRLKLSLTRMGHTVSEETRAKISAFHKGRKHTPEQIAKHANALRGRKRTIPETFNMVAA